MSYPGASSTVSGIAGVRVRRVSAGLNKGEARNSLARAVFFYRLGEIRDRSYENQRYRASGLNLVVAAITLWNTVTRKRKTMDISRSLENTGICSQQDVHLGSRKSGQYDRRNVHLNRPGFPGDHFA